MMIIYQQNILLLHTNENLFFTNLFSQTFYGLVICGWKLDFLSKNFIKEASKVVVLYFMLNL